MTLSVICGEGKGTFTRNFTSAFAFFFDLCRLILENAHVKCKYHHLLLKNPFLTIDENANADVACEQGLTPSMSDHTYR